MKDELAKQNVVMLGVIQEQHPERCRLFMQWKQMKFPIVADPINLLGARAVPIVIAIDEHGVVRSTRTRTNWVRDTFLSTKYDKPDQLAAKSTMSDDVEQLQRIAQSENTASAWTQLGDGYLFSGNDADLSKALQAYDRALQQDSKLGAQLAFRKGVVLRRRYEQDSAKLDDFHAAVGQWSRALELDPNHYIYRRRIQQYGPRLIKPYPFYDWVATAQREIKARGEEPVKLRVSPSGAEIAQPRGAFADASTVKKSPDPDGKIQIDQDGWIHVSAVQVPERFDAKKPSRIHVMLNPTDQAHWNNEAEGVVAWIDPPEGWEASRRYWQLQNPAAAESRETRSFDFELKPPTDWNGASTTLSGYVLYYVCEEAGGQCVYRRQDFKVELE